MEILVIGGTRYFGIHLVEELIEKGHNVTIATRGMRTDTFGNRVKRVIVERTASKSMAVAFDSRYFDVVYDNIAYCSNDIKYALDSINCRRYVMTSSISVYDHLYVNTTESDFDPLHKPLIWCNRENDAYDEMKRLSECALFQAYPLQNSVAVRFPFVIGTDDYTQRLYFYIKHIVDGIPVFIDNIDAQMGFISSMEAGRFLAFLAEQECTGAVNAGSMGTISLQEIITYVEKQTGKHLVLSETGDCGPYNGAPDYSINTRLASDWGFHFSPLKPWIFDLIDNYIDEAMALHIGS